MSDKQPKNEVNWGTWGDSNKTQEKKGLSRRESLGIGGVFAGGLALFLKLGIGLSNRNSEGSHSTPTQTQENRAEKKSSLLIMVYKSGEYGQVSLEEYQLAGKMHREIVVLLTEQSYLKQIGVR